MAQNFYDGEDEEKGENHFKHKNYIFLKNSKFFCCVGVSQFMLKTFKVSQTPILYFSCCSKMVSDPVNEAIICWSPDGTEFIIKVLPFIFEFFLIHL